MAEAQEDEEIRVDAAPVISSRGDDALRTLARLIGRQIGPSVR